MALVGPALFALLLVLGSQGVVLAKKPCTESLRTFVKRGYIKADGSLQAEDGSNYRNGTFWEKGLHWWACPCLSGHPCVRLCQKIYAEKVNITMAERRVRVKVWEGQERWVLLEDQFRIIRDAPCDSAYMLNVEEEALDESLLLANGSLFYPHPNVSADLRIEPVQQFCIIPQEGKEQAVLICHDQMMEEKTLTKLKYKIYPAFFILSAIFLLLTLIAFYLTPDHNTVHGRSVVCQSGSLLIMYLGLTFNYLSGETNHISACIIIAYITYYFLMASFFWLNVMCIDIYLAFKGSMLRKHEHKVIAFSLYAWGAPFIIFFVTVILEITTKSDTFSPGVGQKRCWFQGFMSELLYFNGWVLLLLLSNVFLFGSTAIGLWRLKKESKKMLKDGESQVHTSGGSNQHNKDRLALYVKLFLLMGGTWIMEIVSWAVGGPSSIWFITDTVNSLRGALIFWFCVWSDKSMRNELMDRFRSKKKKQVLKAASTAGHSSVFSISSRMTSQTKF